MKAIRFHKDTILQNIIFLLFVLGLFLPSSRNKIITHQLQYVGWGILFILFVSYLLIQRSYNKIQILIAVSINLILFIFTIISPFNQYSPGAYLSFLDFSLLICLDLKLPRLGNLFKYLLIGSSFILIIGAFLAVFKLLHIDNLLVKYYSFGTEWTMVFMVDARKPVLMFGSHSIAAFYYFIFFFLNYHSLKIFKKNLYLIICILFIFIMVLLRSVTGYGFAAIALVIIANSFLITPKRAIFLSVPAVAIGIWAFIKFQKLWEAIFNLGVMGTFSSSGNGFLGRYDSHSLLSSTIDYIKEHPLHPIGLGYSENLFFTDSGPIIYWLRGSIFLVAAMYIGLLGVIMNNSRRAYLGLLLFCFFMLFELGYPNLIYMRTVYLVPFIIAYLNYLRKHRDEGSSVYVGEA